MTREALDGLTVVLASMGVAASACTEGGTRPAPAASTSAEAPEPADSLAVTLPDTTEIWYTLARTGQAPGGASCLERGIEIRHDGERKLVPLLYTRDIPEILDDSTVTARIYRDCAPGNRYRVNLRTGQPTPIR